MSLKLGDTVTKTCQPIKTGVVFRLFDLKCTNILQKIPPDGVDLYKSKPPKNSKRDDYVSYEQPKGIAICEPTTSFAKKYTLLRMKIKMAGKCPWFEHGGVKYTGSLTYQESLSPSNFVSSPATLDQHTWNKDTEDDQNYQTVPFGDPYGFDSDGFGKADLKLSIIDSEPDNPCNIPSIRLDATLIKMGRDYDFLAGTAEHQVRFASCTGFLNGAGGLTGFWTAVSFAHGPIGLVMTLSYDVRGSMIFT